MKAQSRGLHYRIQGAEAGWGGISGAQGTVGLLWIQGRDGHVCHLSLGRARVGFRSPILVSGNGCSGNTELLAPG